MRTIDWKVFWRINFDVINSVPRLQLEMTLWEFTNGNVRLERSVTDLTFGMVPMGIVSFVGDRAIFEGGYLDCTVDLDIEAAKLLNLRGIPLPPMSAVIEEESESLGGENINIRADVVLNPQSGKEIFPLFYFPQPNMDGVRLIENLLPDGNQAIDWAISSQAPIHSVGFNLAGADLQHRVRVQQDSGTGGLDQYELLADSLPVGTGSTIPNHLFSGATQQFFIGATPDLQLEFFGEIVSLEFDPNGTCKNCPGLPPDQ